MNQAKDRGGILQAFHRTESGAVALLCLAGTLIVFMTALVMFDSGWASQEKLRTQTSADSAAYSNAAVKARSLNSIAYMNVVKRSLIGMFEMYVGMMYFFRLELEETLECLQQVTEEMADYEGDLEGFEGEMDSYEADMEAWRDSCSGGGGGGGGGGPGDKGKAGHKDGDCDDEPDRPEPPDAPATTICPGCELVEGSSPLSGVTFPDYSMFGIDMNSILNAIVMATSEQTCPIKDIFDAEAFLDWNAFAKTDAYELTPGPYGTYDDAMDGVVTKFIRVNLRSLTDFQDLLITNTPRWAVAEAEQRALFSGAHVIDFPAEPAALPLKKGRWLDFCLSKDGHVDTNNKTGEALRQEIRGNILAHTLHSHPDSGFDQLSHSEQGAEYMQAPGCRAAMRSLHMYDSARFQEAFALLAAGNTAGFRAAMADLGAGEIGDDRGHMRPYHNTEEAVFDLYGTARRSHLTEEGTARDKFNFLADDYQNPDDYKPDLYKGMSCGEAVNLDPSFGMWRSSWGARIAPIEECDEELYLHWK